MAERVWIGLVTFERREEGQHPILPDWAQGACGWMVALAASETEAAEQLVSDVENVSLRVLEIDDIQEIHHRDEIAETDQHLFENFIAIEPGKQTVWGTLYGYKGEGEV
jgi:hypothetical protein